MAHPRCVIYLNHAGTSWPPPEPVQEAVMGALKASPESWPTDFGCDHQAIASWLGVPDPTRLLPTPGCTSALAVALADLPWEPGDRVICGSFEHHALHRPLSQLPEVELVVIPPTADSPFDLAALDRELARGARLVATAWAGNVTGALAPVREIVARAHARGAIVLLDAAQVAGWLPIDVSGLGVDLLAFAGHKGPQAPWGIGGLYVAPHVQMMSPRAVCEIGGPPCAPMPGYCDTGSVDRAALAGLVAGLAWLDERPDRLARARRSVARLTEALPEGCVVRGPKDPEKKVPTLAFTTDRATPAELGARLRERGVLVAAGLQCAPRAHETLGTDPDGVLRLSVGPATRDQEIDATIDALRAVLA